MPPAPLEASLAIEDCDIGLENRHGMLKKVKTQPWAERCPLWRDTRSYLKKRILVQGQGDREVQPGGILRYFEDLNRVANAEIGPKNFFERAST
jgi:hypothetical protein